MNQRQIPVKAVAEIVINVYDIDKMRRFYEEVLGFTFFSQHPAENPTIVFLTINALDSPLGRGGHPQLFALIDVHRHRPGQFQGIDQRLTSLNHIAFEIDPDDFESAKQYLLDRGLAVQIQIFPHMNARALFFTDPEGNRLEYICHDETLHGIRTS